MTISKLLITSLAALCCSNAGALELTPEPTKFYLTAADLGGPWRELDAISLDGIALVPGDVVVSYGNGVGGGTYCYHILKGGEPKSFAELSKNGYSGAVDAFKPLLNHWINASNQRNCNIVISDPASLVVLYVVSTDPNHTSSRYRSWAIISKKANVVPQPVSCSATVSPMDFGIVGIRRGGVNRSSSELSASCDKPSTVTVQVNGGRPINDSSTGAVIVFDPVTPKSCTSCTITVFAEMQQSPSVPGKYQWGAPILVSYE